MYIPIDAIVIDNLGFAFELFLSFLNLYAAKWFTN